MLEETKETSTGLYNKAESKQFNLSYPQAHTKLTNYWF